MTIPLPERLVALRVCVELPDVALQQLIGPCETLAQVGLTVWGLPAGGETGLAEVRAIFAQRALLGLVDVTDETLDAAIAQQPAFVIARVGLSTSALHRCATAEIPVVQPAFSPAEVVGLANTSDAVAVWPAQVLEPQYAGAIKPLIQSTPLIARGDFPAETGVAWLNNGCDIISIGSRFAGSGLTGKASDLRRVAKVLRIS